MGGIGRYVIQRLLLTVPMVFLLLTVVFLVLHVLPGDPVAAMLGGRNLSPQVLEDYRARLGLDQPVFVQYWRYVSGVLQGDFGTSLRTGSPVLHELFLRFPATIELAICGLLVSIVLGIVTGIFAATHADHLADHGIRLFHITSFAMPLFWLGLMFQIFFAVRLGWLPVAGRLGGRLAFTFHSITGFYVLDALIQGNWAALADSAKHLVLPGITLGIALTGLQGRMSRASMLEVLDTDYITTARSKGIPERVVVLGHALRNALIPIVTVFGLQFAVLMGGAVLTETVCSWPGIAYYLVRAIDARDYAAIQGAVVFIAVFISVINLLVDIFYSLIDPRVRY